MIGHQRVGMNSHGGTPRGYSQPMQVTNVVCFLKKAGRTIIATLDNVLRYVGRLDAR